MNKTILNEIVKMRGLMSAKSGQLISEQSYEELIGKQILDATKGFGTNEPKLLTAVKSFKDDKAFWNTNSWLKANGGRDFFRIVGSEMESDNLSDIQAISDVLKNLGIQTSFEKTSNGGYKPYSFRHTGGSGSGGAAKTKDKAVTAKAAPKKTNTQVTQKFQQTVKELNPNSSGNMDVETLQQILNSLEGGNTNQNQTSSTPDIAQLQTALNQLG